MKQKIKAGKNNVWIVLAVKCFCNTEGLLLKIII